mmetsp:Transcript_7965/g.8721  ORF Transcript_7965/g.8721 Transcript_7965/m.8721 type:complete len:134 (+) Transcript_7965:15-416(+)
MKFASRTFLSMIIQGRKETLLSCYVNFLKEDLDWANDPLSQPLILDNLKAVLIENLDEIEKQSRLDNKNYTHLRSGEHILVSFAVRNGKAVETLQILNDGRAKHFFQPNFHLVLWIFRDSHNSNLDLLAIEDI